MSIPCLLPTARSVQGFMCLGHDQSSSSESWQPELLARVCGITHAELGVAIREPSGSHDVQNGG